MKKILLLPFFLMMITVAGFAQDKAGLKLLVEGGIEFGGDEILMVLFTNGGDQVMRAGQGGYLAVGGQLTLPIINRLMVRGTVGWKYNTTAADNANIRFTRVPINLLGYWKLTDAVRVGAGISAHQNINFKGDGFVPDVDFAGAIGPRFELGYKWIALTYTVLEYTDDMDNAVAANAIGVSLSFTFPNN